MNLENIESFKYTREYLKSNNIAISVSSDDDKRALCKIYGLYYPSNDIIFLRWIYGEEQFKWAVNANSTQTIIPASEIITAYEASKQPDRKIIGYKVPFDLYRGDIKKGCIATQSENYDFWEISGLSIKIQLPPEIVKTWEPVYEEQKPVFGSFEDIVAHFKGNLVSIATSIAIHLKEDTRPITPIIVTKENFSFTPEFEQKLNELGIKI